MSTLSPVLQLVATGLQNTANAADIS